MNRTGVVTEVSQKEDNAAYMRLYRERSPKYRERANRIARERWRALEEVARNHNAEFLRIYERNLKDAGLK